MPNSPQSMAVCDSSAVLYKNMQAYVLRKITSHSFELTPRTNRKTRAQRDLTAIQIDCSAETFIPLYLNRWSGEHTLQSRTCVESMQDKKLQPQ